MPSSPSLQHARRPKGPSSRCSLNCSPGAARASTVTRCAARPPTSRTTRKTSRVPLRAASRHSPRASTARHRLPVRKSGGLFRHMMLRHSSAEEGSRVEATLASRTKAPGSADGSAGGYLLRDYVDHVITFLFDMIDDLDPLVHRNEKCVNCNLLIPGPLR